ncbi:MAG: hypothetical protein HC929_17045 [Leptolyngbyaceae cyanobacterium SM2_5_2]|nr:hypothetical protein [Leptolyngbyaceae cyanobacterium SM2_5_2]
MGQTNPARLRELAADIEMELSCLERLELSIDQVNAAIAQEPQRSELFYENLALKLHNFYTSCEKILQLIATELNGGLLAGSDWHKRLLDRMATEREGRPAVLRSATAAALREFLGFRHVVRNLYGYELDSERVARLVEKYPHVWQHTAQDYRTFVACLQALARE